jgi:suppressor of tumorigenicity protein 13
LKSWILRPTKVRGVDRYDSNWGISRIFLQFLIPFSLLTETIKSYISKLEAELFELKGEEDDEEMDEAEEEEEDSADFPPLYSSGDDMEKAGQLKMEAGDLKAESKWQEALEKYTEAVLAAPPSALLYANRATVLLKLEQYRAAERDCTEALKINPDSAKALRIRGKAYEHMEKWEKARADLRYVNWLSQGWVLWRISSSIFFSRFNILALPKPLILTRIPSRT